MKFKASLIAALLLPLAALAQDAWPSRPITFVVPFPPGGPTDLMARLIGPALSKRLNVPVVVENKAGASGNIGTGQVVRAKPDGYTILLAASGNLSANQYLYPKLGFDPVKDLTPIVQISKFPLVLEVAENSKIRSFKDYVDAVRQPNNRITFGSASNGTPQHLGAELFKDMAKVDMTHVPYKGTGPALNDLVAGHVDIIFMQLESAIKLHEGKKARILAVTTDKRISQLPDVPTMEEVGIKGLISDTWNAISAPPGTPAPVVAKLNAALNEALKDPELAARFKQLLLTPGGGDVAKTRAFIEDDTKRWSEVIKEANIPRI
jgi:tripartite-type tricarboxylate transporter receptor subunit TctC